MKNKKIITFMLSMAILLPIADTNSTATSNDSVIIVNAEEEYTAETSFIFEFDNETMTATLKSFNGDETVVNIPRTVGNGTYTVTSIDKEAFKDNTVMTSVNMPDTITNIGNYAFEGCTYLTTVKLSDNITLIPYRCFINCTSLNTINVPNGVTEIGESAFEECTSLINIDLPNTLEILNGSVFKKSGLESIVIPNSVTTIKGGGSPLWTSYGCFDSCKNLKEVTLSNSLNEITSLTFADCTSLEEIVIPNSVTTIGVAAFANCSSLSKVTMSNNIETVEGNGDNGWFLGTFQGCSLKEIILPSSIKSIGKKSFGYSTSNGYDGGDPIEDFTIYYYTAENRESEAIVLSYASENGFKAINLGIDPSTTTTTMTTITIPTNSSTNDITTTTSPTDTVITTTDYGETITTTTNPTDTVITTTDYGKTIITTTNPTDTVTTTTDYGKTITTTTNNKDISSPSTSDKGVLPIMIASAFLGITAIVTSKKKD